MGFTLRPCVCCLTLLRRPLATAGYSRCVLVVRAGALGTRHKQSRVRLDYWPQIVVHVASTTLNVDATLGVGGPSAACLPAAPGPHTSVGFVVRFAGDPKGPGHRASSWGGWSWDPTAAGRLDAAGDADCIQRIPVAVLATFADTQYLRASVVRCEDSDKPLSFTVARRSTRRVRCW